MATLIESVNEVRDALIEAEKAHPDSKELAKLHRRLERAFTTHGSRLGLTEGEVATLAGGGTPKKKPDKET